MKRARSAVAAWILGLGAMAMTCSPEPVGNRVAALEHELASGNYSGVLDGLPQLSQAVERSSEPYLSVRVARLGLIAEAGVGNSGRTLALLEQYEQLTARKAPPDLYARAIWLLDAAHSPFAGVLDRANVAYPGHSIAFSAMAPTTQFYGLDFSLSPEEILELTKGSRCKFD